MVLADIKTLKESFDRLSGYDKILTKPAKKEELKQALSTQMALSAEEDYLRRMNVKLEQAEKELEVLRKVARTTTACISSSQRRLKDLRKDRHFRSVAAIDCIRSQMEVIDDLSSTVRPIVLGTNDQEQSSVFQCSVCYSTPIRVFSCSFENCENWICDGCFSRLKVCPFCRCSFAQFEPRRNRTVERMIQHARGRMQEHPGVVSDNEAAGGNRI